MGKIYKLSNPKDAADLFAGWQETLIDSCLQGVMGEIYAASSRSAMAMLGDFCFLAGEPDAELVAYKPEECDKDFMIMVPQGSSRREPMGNRILPDPPQKLSWEKLIRQIYGDKARQVTRYAIKKEEHIWDLDRLREALAGLPPEYTLRLIDKELYRKCMENDWSRDLVAQYRDYEQYRKLGLGAAILQGQEIVAGASSYSSYEGGIEIEIDTRKDHRRKGLAYICGARLILECCSRGLYPSWDAQNLQSVALAEKLGYHFDHAYTAYEIWGYGSGCQRTGKAGYLDGKKSGEVDKYEKGTIL